MMRLLPILLSVFFCYETALAAPMKLETVKGQIFVPTLEDWKLGKDMYGMPFILFSPQQNGQRSNISLTATGVDVEVDLTELGNQHKSYEKLKTNWAKTVSATPEKFQPYKKWKNDHGHNVHQMGFEYKHEEKSYVENSFYVDCRGRLIFLKSLRLKENASHDQNFSQLVRELDCSL
jgi:hypothetical protein